MASGVPKFTSFRPKPKDSLQPKKEPPKEDEQTHPVKSSRDRRTSEISGQSKRDRSRERLRKPEKPSRESTQDRNTARREETPRVHSAQHSRPSDMFFSDRRGDRDIVKYGSLNRHDVPDYRRYGYGYVLGLPLDRKIDRDLSTEKTIVLTSSTGHRDQRLLTKKHATREQSRAVRFVSRSKGEEADDLTRDYIAFSITRKRKRSEDDADNNEDGSEFDYRGIHNATPGEPTDPDAEYESDTILDPVNAGVTARNSTLVRRTKDHPEDLQAWLDLVEYQETMMKMERSSTELRNADRQHLAEVRISIYEQALRKAISDENGQISLYCGMMTEAIRTWSEAQLASKWTEILVKFPFSADLWLKYLDFVQSSFTSFKYEACKTTFQKCLETLQLTPTTVNADLCLYIITRLTSMIHQAGYQELALAIWQALLEYSMLAPVTSPQATGQALQAFEEFWESEVPRAGEDNAKGWRKSNVEDGPLLVTDSVRLNEPDPVDDGLDDFRKREMDCISKLRNPGRTIDELGEDDPFHTVLFSDIEVFLKLLPQPCKKGVVLSAFLQFCGLPPLMRDDSCGDRYVFDPFLQTESPDALSKDTDGFTQLISSYTNCPIKKFQLNTQLLFNQGFPMIPKAVDIEFVRNVLKLLATGTPDEESIGEYLLALESQYFPGEAFKTAKQLLKARPTSLRLYNAYGLVESRRNNPTKADQVFSAALSMQKGGAPFLTSYSLDLFYSWVWEALRQGKRKEALWRLVSPTGKVTKLSADADEIPNQAALLRTQRALSDTYDQALLRTDFTVAVLSMSLIAMMAYLSGGEKQQSGLAAFGQLSAWFTSHKMSQSPAAELHAQYVAEFLTYHAEHASIVKPALLRESLEPLIAAFPDNTILLSTYSANEARFAIDDRVRSIMHRNSNEKGRTIVGWTFAIHYETLRAEIAGKTSHSIRALFKRAEDDIGVHCPALWKQHVLFEVAQARKEREKRPSKRPRKDGKKSKEELRMEEANERVRATFFRGMTRLPWCKTYMMMAFTHLGDEFLSKDDLKKVYNVMVEKELRLYVELDEAGA